MEVHHHPQHSHEKKTWKNYFWEFFMLFLAVFCGSLAELQVEHYVEHQREKRFIKQLSLDLNADEENLRAYIGACVIRESRIDSLFFLMSSDAYHKKINDVYFFARVISRYGNYVPTDGTISQLKFSGNLRLIKNDQLVTNLLEYDTQTKVLTQFIITSFQDIINFRLSAEELFDGKAFYDMIDSANEIQRLQNCPALIDSSYNKINKLVMRLQYMKSANSRYIHLAQKLLQKEKEIKALIHKEYHLEKE